MSKKNRVPVNLVQITTRLAAQTTLWEPLIAYDPISRYYARLARESDFEAWLLTWVPGQGTEWHDHGGSAGAFITVRGSLTYDHPGDFQSTVALVQEGRLQPGRIVTDEFALEDVQIAFERSATTAGKTWIRVDSTLAES